MSQDYIFYENGIAVVFPDNFDMDAYMESFDIRGEKTLADGTKIVLRIGGLNDRN